MHCNRALLAIAWLPSVVLGAAESLVWRGSSEGILLHHSDGNGVHLMLSAMQGRHLSTRQLQQSRVTCPMTSFPQGFEANSGSLTLPAFLEADQVCFSTQFSATVTDEFVSTRNRTTLRQDASYYGTLVTFYPVGTCAQLYANPNTTSTIFEVMELVMRLTANKPYTTRYINAEDVCVDTEITCPAADHACTGCPASCPSSLCRLPWYLDTSTISLSDVTLGDSACCEIWNCTAGDAAFRSSILSGPAPKPGPPGDSSSKSGSSSKSSSGSKLGIIIGAVVGGLVLVGLIVGAVWWKLRKDKAQPKSGNPVQDTARGKNTANGYPSAGPMMMPPGYGTGQPQHPGSMQYPSLGYPTGGPMQPPPAGWMMPTGGMAAAAGYNKLKVDVGHTDSTTTTSTAPITAGSSSYASGNSSSMQLPTPSPAQPSPAAQHMLAYAPQPLYQPPVTGGSTEMTSTQRAGSAALSPTPIPPSDSMRASSVLEGMRISWSDITVQGLLGEGGFGKVYKGTWQGNRVAVKVLNPERANANVLKELQAEAYIMSELRHPCIARVFGLVDEPPNHALVMAYYRRGTLTKFMSTSAYQDMPLVAKLRMAQQVAGGMRFLHEKKPVPILHGDLKTSNLLLEDDGRVVIADFGLARSTTSAAAAARTGALTLSIAPPEVLSNPYAPRTASADVYAFAMVLLEMLTGKAPFKGLKPSELKQVVAVGRRPPLPEMMPTQVCALIADCWAQEARDRPSFAVITSRLAAVIEALEPNAIPLDTTTGAGSTYTRYSGM